MKTELRICDITNAFHPEENIENCYFHRWFEEKTVLRPSPMIGGHPGGQCSKLYAIVETPEGFIKKVDPIAVVFKDDSISEMNTLPIDITEATRRFSVLFKKIGDDLLNGDGKNEKIVGLLKEEQDDS